MGIKVFIITLFLIGKNKGILLQKVIGRDFPEVF